MKTLLIYSKILLLCTMCAALVHADLAPCLSKISSSDSIVNVWLILADKPSLGLQKRNWSLQRTTWMDTHLELSYLDSLKHMNVSIRQTFAWANAVSISVTARALPELAAKPFIAKIIPVRTFLRLQPHSTPPARTKLKASDTRYGSALTQLTMIGIPRAHEFILSTLHQQPGRGIRVAVFDNGFTLTHPCFAAAHANNAFIADSDFVDHDSSVGYPQGHGTQTLALIAGYDSLQFTGGAWGAQFLLARTENDASELHIEEDSWAAAVVWAQEKGAHIINSSLGYLNFEVPDSNYTFADLDGKTTIISRAAREACRRGVIIVNAMGNEGNSASTISAPADVDSVISVGAVGFDSSIAYFSSNGPTADGRIKPDLVAPGLDVLIPEYNTQGYTTNQGTSFSAPLIASICALILQTHPSASADDVRALLYSSCTFVKGQTSMNNTYGRGLPDAFAAVFFEPYSFAQIAVYPTVLHYNDPLSTLRWKYLPQQTTAHFDQSYFELVIRNVNGLLIFKTSRQYFRARELIAGSWNLRTTSGKPIAPGTYLVTARIGNNIQTKKIIIRE